MKYLNIGKKKAFPYAVVRKKTLQQWDFLRQLLYKQKRLYRNNSRFYSLELGRSFSKKILWQIAAKNSFSHMKEKNFFSYHRLKATFFEKKPNYETSLISVKEEKQVILKINSFQQPWSVFRSLLFGKVWMLYNPALVPGVVWPVKNKKSHVAKIRAFKTMAQLVGKSSLNFLKRNLQKLWNLSNTTPSVWSLVSGLNSLKPHLLLKSGFACTIPEAYGFISGKKLFLNGFAEKKGLGFYYPGDFVSVNFNPSLALGTIFTHGTRKANFSATSVHSVLPFMWLSSFYKYGKVVDIYGQQKQRLKRHFMFSKNSAKKKPYKYFQKKSSLALKKTFENIQFF